MTIDEALEEWNTKKRRMGCVAATDWFCKRVPGFSPIRYRRFTPEGDTYDHVVATDGVVRIDLCPNHDAPLDGKSSDYLA